MTAYERRSYPGGAVATTITADCLIGAMSLILSDSSGWVGTNPITAMLDYDTSSAEKVYGTVSGSVFTIIQRGYDGTAEVDHKAGAKVRVVWDATDADEANQAVVNTIGKVTTLGDLLVGSGANTLKRLGVGAAHAPLRVNSAGTDLEYRSGAWTTYTPTVGGTGWAVGNGTVAGRYRYLDDKTLALSIVFTTGSTTTAGTGQLTLTLPSGVNAKTTYGGPSGEFVQNGVDDLPCQARLTSASNVMTVSAALSSGLAAITSSLTNGVPTGSIVALSGVVEIA